MVLSDRVGARQGRRRCLEHARCANVHGGYDLPVTGVVGQRATKKDAPDGYRLCPRGRRRTWWRSPARGAPAGRSGETTRSHRARHGAAGGSPRRFRSAPPSSGSTKPLAIEAIVTAPATLLDSTGRRIVVQDGSAAIEVLLPSGDRRSRPLARGSAQRAMSASLTARQGFEPTSSRDLAPGAFRHRSTCGRRRPCPRMAARVDHRSDRRRQEAGRTVARRSARRGRKVGGRRPTRSRDPGHGVGRGPDGHDRRDRATAVPDRG